MLEIFFSNVSPSYGPHRINCEFALGSRNLTILLAHLSPLCPISVCIWQRLGNTSSPGLGMALDKNFTFRSMTRQDYFCLYDAIHTLVRQDEITKEQVLSPYASELVRSFCTRTRARPRALTLKYRRDLCGKISPFKIFFSSIAVSILVAFLRILLEGSTKVRMQHTAHMFRELDTSGFQTHSITAHILCL